MSSSACRLSRPTRLSCLSHRSRGFTLIELIITVAIVAILAAVALPAYTSYLRRGDLAEAFSTLSAYRVTMEQYYQDNRSYGSGTTCGPTTPSSQFFTITCALKTGGAGYTLTATGSGRRTTGYDYTVDEANAKKTTKFANASSTKTCWLIKGSEC